LHHFYPDISSANHSMPRTCFEAAKIGNSSWNVRRQSWVGADVIPGALFTGHPVPDGPLLSWRLTYQDCQKWKIGKSPLV